MAGRLISAGGFLLVLLLVLSPPGVRAQGYTMAGNQILIDQSAHWEAWDVGGGMAEILPEGAVRPRFMRKHVNVARNAGEFSAVEPGGVVASSNQRDTAFLVDGDEHTSWGPDRGRPLEDWRFTLSLGRLVVATRIVLRFAPEGEGDPFLQFKVLAWRNGPPRQWEDFNYVLRGTNVPRFWEVGRTQKPNKTQRVFEFVPPTTQDPDDSFVGDAIEFVQVVVTDSDFDRGQEVSRAEYEDLPEEQKGAVEHYTRSTSGREALISQEGYGTLDPTYRGPIRYYRREMPRLAEIEVWTPGDNINLGAVDRGGLATIETNAGEKEVGAIISDGLYSTGANGSIFPETTYTFFEDLGALFWLDTLHYLLDGASPVHELFVDVSDGTLAPDGSIKWTRVARSIVEKNYGDRLSGLPATPGSRYRLIEIDPVKVRFIRTLFRNPLVELSFIGFTEVLLYGEGHVAEVELTSDLIELGGEKNLIAIEWEADTPPGTSVQLQTRTGNELEEEKIYYDSKGIVVTEKRYNSLPKSKKGEIESLFKPHPDWDPWSSPYQFSGASITSPSPREYMLIRARLLSDRPDAVATLHAIRVALSEPLVDQLVGEVWPNRLQTGDSADSLSYFIRPTFSSSQQGFDELMIEASAGTVVDLLEVRLGQEAGFRAGSADRFSPDQLEIFAQGADTLWFRLPDRVDQRTELIEVVLRPTIRANSASFRASVQDSDHPGFWQRVDAGEATGLVGSQVTTVVALAGNQVIRDLRLDSVVLTPNGDGVNDALEFAFDVAVVSAAREVRLVICDLGGRPVWEMVERRPDPRGSYTFVWTGGDDDGDLVPPGIYVARLEVDVDSESAAATRVARVVHLAY